MKKANIMTPEDLDRVYLRFAHQFLEGYDDVSQLAIIGMQTRGVYMGKRILKEIKASFDADIDFGVLDVAFYRDDYRSKF
ncbi:MAG TPA: bifunctional pyr operon transcriptional regulator/uracil phosphoribosyltransferase, partial [Balneolaceae bacterium]|nr:bifunctional pyr operon transcriptional regulator/uracil phosphoribosyltransferase [Balneolaceae bacterium]